MVWSEILIVLALVLLNGFFAMSELALVSSRAAELRRRADKGSRGARVALDLIADPSALLSTVQIGITLVGIVAGAYSGATLGAHLSQWLDTAFPALDSWSEPVAMGTVIGAITYLSLVVGELVPKRLAMRHAEPIAVFAAPVMRHVARFGAPLVKLLGLSTNALLRLLGQNPDETRTVTQEEMRALIAEGSDAGIIDPMERQMLDRVMRLADRAVGSVMTPRLDVEWVDADAPPEEWRRRLLESPHSRLPVARGSLDNLVGILDTRHLLERLMTGQSFDPMAVVRQAPMVHEDTKMPRIIQMLRGNNSPMAVVLDEYGSMEGIVTLSDILDAISGEEAMGRDDADSMAVRRPDGSWLMDGLLPIQEAEALTGLHGMAEGHDFHTLAGFILAKLAHLPQVGESFAWENWRFEVMDMDGRRIDRILMTPPEQSPETQGSGI